MSTTLKYFSIIMGENLWRFSSLSLVLALGLIIDFSVMMYLSHVGKSSKTPSNLPSQRVSERKTKQLSRLLLTVALFLSFFPVFVGVMIQGLYQVFRQRLAMSLADIFLDI